MKFFGMTIAKKWTNREPEICRNRNESTFRQNIGHSTSFPGNNKATWAQSNNFNEKIQHEQTLLRNLHITWPLQ